MKTFLLLVLLGAGLYFFVFRSADLEPGVGGPVTLEMKSDDVLKEHGKPAQLHSERGGREVWIYEDGRLVEFVDHQVTRSEPPGPNTWDRLADGRWIRQVPGVTGKTTLAKKSPKGPTPRGSAAANEAREKWGWGREGTSLDQPAKPGSNR